MFCATSKHIFYCEAVKINSTVTKQVFILLFVAAWWDQNDLFFLAGLNLCRCVNFKLEGGLIF